MDKIDRTLTSRNHLTVVPPSPRLVRSRSGSSPAMAITTPERSSHRFSSSERFTNIQRSKSTSKTRTTNNEGNSINVYPTLITSISTKPTNNRVQDKKNRDDGFVKFLQRGVSPDNNVGASKRTTSTAKSPSAWALSPGRRSFGSAMGPQLPTRINNNGGSGSSGSTMDPQLSTRVNYNSNSGNSRVSNSVIKVLKYFKQKKVSSVQEEEYHRFRILHNRLLQWRFINARAEAAMNNVKNIAEIQVFSVWLGILMLRKITIQKRIELQKVKHLIKLYKILNGQLYLLAEWAQLERRNQESVARLSRKLSSLCTLIPLTHHVK
ncbi:QWRF motif-containing protein 7, partial [Mucuna pruriens]